MPLLGWFFGSLVAVLLEHWVGDYLAELLGLPKIPILFGLSITVKNIKLMALSMFGDNPAQVTESLLIIFSAIFFIVIIYVVPIVVCGRLLAGLFNRIAQWLLEFPTVVSVLVHLLLLYAILHVWSDLSPYRSITLRLTLIAIMFTLSLNIINGYMGEFSCSHPGFMALGPMGHPSLR